VYGDVQHYETNANKIRKRASYIMPPTNLIQPIFK